MGTLITGGTGFVGLALAERLIADGDEVVLFGANAPPSSVLEQCEIAAAKFAYGDIRSVEDVDRVLSQGPFERVVHMAAITPGPERERAQAGRIVDVNIGGTVNLIERVTATQPIRRIVVVSSVAVYGFSPPAPSGLYEEATTCPAPAALYGITKLAAEQTALRLGVLHDLDVRIARLGPVFGPWEYATGLRDALSPHLQVVSQARAGRAVILPRPMAADWIYSRDAASGLAALLRAGSLNHSVYNLGGGRITDLEQWSRALAAQLGGFAWRVAAPGEAATVAYGLPQDRAALCTARLLADTAHRNRFDPATAASDFLAWAGEARAEPETRGTHEAP